MGSYRVSMKHLRVRVRIKGLVQGVFFRASTMEMGRRHCVNGWVRNLPDGSVEALMEGEEDAVNNLLEWCQKGPPEALVNSVTVNIEKYTGELGSFCIMR